MRRVKISPTGRRGVGGLGSGSAGATPTRMMTCGTTSRVSTLSIASRAVGSSVMWVSAQVANPSVVHSSSSAETASPVCSQSATVFPVELSTSSRAWSSSSPRRCEYGAEGKLRAIGPPGRLGV